MSKFQSIKEHESYQCNRFGVILGKNGLIMNGTLDKDGYIKIKLDDKHLRAH